MSKIKLGDTDIPFVFRGDELMYPNYVKDGLVLHYDFSGMTNADTSRGITTDLSGNGNHGTLQNFNYSAESGYDKNKLLFDGVDDRVYSTKPHLTGNLNSITIEVVLSINKLGTVKRIVDQSFEYFSLAIFANNKINFNTGNLSIRNNYSNYTFTDTKPHHIVASYHNGTGEMIIYVDGIMDTYIQNSGELRGNELSVYIGTGHATNQYLDGKVNTTKIYNRPLTPEEIAHNYAIEKERFGIE